MHAPTLKNTIGSPIKFLSTSSSLRRSVEAVAAGTSWELLPPDFVEACAPLKFVPVAERVIEARHSLAARALVGKKKRRSGTTVSRSGGRFAEFEMRCGIDNSVFFKVSVRKC